VKTLLSVLLLFVLVLPTLPAAAQTGFIACNDSNDVIPFDVITYALGTSIPLPHTYPYPYDATMTQDGAEVWVADASGDHVVVIDVATSSIVTTIPVGEYPTSVAFTHDGRTALISGRDADYVTLIKTSDYSIAGTLTVGTGGGGTYDGPGHIALNPATGYLYAADWYDDTLYEIDPDASAVVRHVDIGSSLWQLVVDPDGTFLYVTDRSTDEVIVVDVPTLSEFYRVPVGDDPWGIDITADGERLVVACEDDATVHIIDTNDWSTVILPMESGCKPKDVDLIEDDGHYAFIAGGDYSGTDAVYVIELAGNTLKQAIRVGGDPTAIAVQAQVSGPVGVEDGEITEKLALRCHPNPFNPKTRIDFRLPEGGETELAVFDVSGRQVAVIERSTMEAGEHSAEWSGRSNDGSPLASGVYFLRLSTEGGSREVKAVLLK
jgi:YVTN family beta-propeller protein